MDGQAIKKQEVAPIKSTSGAPYNKTVEEPKLNPSARQDCRKFEVRCHAGNAGHLEVASDAVSIKIAQQIRREAKEEFWGSLLVECKEQDDGSLAVEVVVFHPDWDEPLRIASIQSNRTDKNTPEPAIRCDFEQKRL
jgi:hypothetical protein